MGARHFTYASVSALALSLAWAGAPALATTDSAAAAQPAASASAAPESAAPTPAPAADRATTAEPAAPAASGPQDATASKPETAAPTASPAAEPSRPATVASPDQAVRQALNGLSSGRFDRIFANRKERSAVEAFYAARDFAPLWIGDVNLNSRAKDAIAYLGSVETEGLDPIDYPTPQLKAGADAVALAEAELRLTASLVAFARHAQSGRVHYTRIAADISYNHAAPEPSEILSRIAGATDLKGTLAGFNPQQPGYKALKAKLAEARARTGEKAAARIPNGPTLKAGMDDPRVPLVRERLGMSGSASTTYDKPVADAVRQFQRKNKLRASGELNGATIAAINGPRRERDADIIVSNMERWRWMPRDLGATYVMVNVPDYSLKVVRNGATVWSTRIVVGKPGNHATPVTSASMTHITVNPTWNVPPSIIQNEYLPAMAQDPTVLERMGLKLVHRPDGTVHIYQPPGERNALGRIRFNFPNKFLVYQHDTPDKHLFAHDRRAYSHGCMRVQDPVKYGEVLLSLAYPNQGWTQDRLRKMFGTAEQDVRLTNPIPVHISYQTAFVDDHGKLVIRDDVYGRDSRVLAVLRGDERKVADVAIERPPSTSTKPVRAPQGMTFASSNNGNFFDRIFGGGPPQPPAPVGRWR